MGRMDGKVALISGGARAGWARPRPSCSPARARQWSSATCWMRRAKRPPQSIAAEGGRCRFVHLDVTQVADWEAAVAEAVSQFGSLDVLVNNAGIGSSSFQIHEEPVELWDRTIDVNLKGVFLGTRTAVPAMLEAGGGSIINISSQLGIVGVPYNGSAYQTSKGGVRIFTKAAALQYADRGIRVNSVHPGPIVTEMTRAGRDDPEPPVESCWPASPWAATASLRRSPTPCSTWRLTSRPSSPAARWLWTEAGRPSRSGTFDLGEPLQLIEHLLL